MAYNYRGFEVDVALSHVLNGHTPEISYRIYPRDAAGARVCLIAGAVSAEPDADDAQREQIGLQAARESIDSHLAENRAMP